MIGLAAGRRRLLPWESHDTCALGGECEQVHEGRENGAVESVDRVRTSSLIQHSSTSIAIAQVCSVWGVLATVRERLFCCAPLRNGLFFLFRSLF